MSNVGKSLITAGLCRLFMRNGHSVCPFKSQNMALNSYITDDGLEIGRAQAMQAEACGIRPDTDMNPILLKPSSDIGSQVILNGEVFGDMEAREYFRRKKDFIPYIMKSYSRLSEKYDIIVIEGAGSPAEINLKTDDIVNMGMAKMAKSPVLLVGDIDRGGVFAQLIGTLELLEPDERKMVKGLIINKFRGDYSILEPGVEMLEKRSGKKVVGSVPYVDLDIDEEDSLSQRFSVGKEGKVDIAVIRFPRISNFTDIFPLEQAEGLSVRYVTKPSDIGDPDMLILPGTKNTIDDLIWLKKCGIDREIYRLKDSGSIIFGICGGFQMLGRVLNDSLGIEKSGIFEGLGLLPVSTVFKGQKTRTNVTGKVSDIGGKLKSLSGKTFKGYEIHMGCSEGDIFMNKTEENKTDGSFSGNIYGTYMHGFFDSEEILNTLAKILLKEKGITKTKNIQGRTEEYKNKQYDILANTLEKHLDMKFIYKVMENQI